jgi:putative flippase GtrA
LVAENDKSPEEDDDMESVDVKRAPLWMRFRELVPARFRAMFPPRFLRFCLVGGTGVFVNVVIFQIFRRFIFTGVDDVMAVRLASLVGIIVSIFTNFMLNNHWTFGDLRHPGASHFWTKLWKYYVGSALGAVVQWSVTQFFFEIVGIWAGISQLIGIGFGVVINFFIQTKWTFRAKSHH